MDDVLMNEYLEKVNLNLKHLTASEKADIINEIRSHIKEKQAHEEIDMKTILENLGDPKQLGRCYSGKTIANTEKFSFMHFARTLVYYSATSIGGFIISMLAGFLYLSAIIMIPCGLVKTVGTVLGYDLPIYILKIGSWELPGLLALPVSIPFALLFYYCSKKLWKVLKKLLSRRL